MFAYCWNTIFDGFNDPSDARPAVTDCWQSVLWAAEAEGQKNNTLEVGSQASEFK